MKSFLIALLAMAMAFTANAQRASVMPIAAGDTINNTGTVTKQLPTITGGYSGVMIQMNLSKISGTGAGTVQLQASLDNTNWVNSGSAFTITNVSTQAAQFTVTSPVPVYLRLLCTGSGTESVATVTYYVYRKYLTTLTTN
jgi:hypothetical protein